MNGDLKLNGAFPVEMDSPLPVPNGVVMGPSESAAEESAMHPEIDEDIDMEDGDAEDCDKESPNWSEEELPPDKRADLLVKVPKEVRIYVR